MRSFPFVLNQKEPVRGFVVPLPFTLPAALRDRVQGRVQAVGVVADVAVVAQQQARGVRGLPTHLAHDALQAAPALTEHHLCDLERRE